MRFVVASACYAVYWAIHRWRLFTAQRYASAIYALSSVRLMVCHKLVFYETTILSRPHVLHARRWVRHCVTKNRRGICRRRVSVCMSVSVTQYCITVAKWDRVHAFRAHVTHFAH